jgi:hypothetical protein
MRAQERRRLVFAATVTAVAIPAMWMIEGGGDGDDAAAATTTTVNALVPIDTADPGVPLYLDAAAPVVAPAVIDIAVPQPPGAREARGAATFKRFGVGPVQRLCSSPLAPSGIELTITNIDNGLSTTCTNTPTVTVPPGADVAIDTQVYMTIAELVEAPVPVRISW